MNTETKFEMMQKILHALEELKNNQATIMQKISEMETDSVSLADTQLEMKLADLYEATAMNVEKAELAFSFYEQKMNEFAPKHFI